MKFLLINYDNGGMVRFCLAVILEKAIEHLYCVVLPRNFLI